MSPLNRSRDRNEREEKNNGKKEEAHDRDLVLVSFILSWIGLGFLSLTSYMMSIKSYNIPL